MTGRAQVLMITIATACTQSHSGQVVEIRNEACVTCHQIEFDATSAPVHETSGFPTTCADCHRTTDWQPALGGLHPDPAFPIAAGPHGEIKCLTCHDLDVAAPSAAGANTDCVQCHADSKYQRDSHAGARGPQGQAYAYTPEVRNFCLSCHPQGRANKHPDDRFPRNGDHNTACVNCHDRSVGPDTDGGNTTCLSGGCHSLSREDSHHREENGYAAKRGDGSNRHFCLECHPRGR